MFCPRDKEASKHAIFSELKQNKYLFRQMREERIGIPKRYSVTAHFCHYNVAM